MHSSAMTTEQEEPGESSNAAERRTSMPPFLCLTKAEDESYNRLSRAELGELSICSFSVMFILCHRTWSPESMPALRVHQ